MYHTKIVYQNLTKIGIHRYYSIGTTIIGIRIKYSQDRLNLFIEILTQNPRETVSSLMEKTSITSRNITHTYKKKAIAHLLVNEIIFKEDLEFKKYKPRPKKILEPQQEIVLPENETTPAPTASITPQKNNELKTKFDEMAIALMLEAKKWTDEKAKAVVLTKILDVVIENNKLKKRK